MQHSFVFTKTSWLIAYLSACSAESDPAATDGDSGTNLTSTTAASSSGGGTGSMAQTAMTAAATSAATTSAATTAADRNRAAACAQAIAPR